MSNLVSDSTFRDPITGLFNVRHLHYRLTQFVARAKRENHVLGIILWDIDGFIQFNNKYGQKEGDIFLTKVAGVLQKNLRVYDEAFRSGPDEFCVIMFPATQAHVSEVKKRVQESVSRNLFEDKAEYSHEKFSISAGVSFFPGPGELPEALLHAAKQDLFHSRNK